MSEALTEERLTTDRQTDRQTDRASMSNPMPHKTTFIVLGAKGATGRLIVAELLARPEDEVRRVLACVRNPDAVPEGTFPSGDARLEIVKHVISLTGPGLPSAAVDSADDVHTVFYAAAGKGYEICKVVDRFGPGLVGKAVADAGIKECRVVLISSQLVDPVNRWNLVRGFLNTINTGLFHHEGMMDFKFQGEQMLRESGVSSWTILRPGRLGDGPVKSSGAISTGQNNASFGSGGSPLARADLATIAVVCAFSPDASNTTVEIGADAKADMQPLDGKQLFSSLRKDVVPEHYSSQYWSYLQ